VLQHARELRGCRAVTLWAGSGVSEQLLVPWTVRLMEIVEAPLSALSVVQFGWDLGMERTGARGDCMRRADAEKYRDIDFSRARRGPVIKPEPGKTKISIRLDNTVLEYFKVLVDRAGGGNYQTLINDALVACVHQRSTLDVVRQVVREELASSDPARRSGPRPGGSEARKARPSGR
jgi:uncharacterized protein (DUF4415 family)